MSRNTSRFFKPTQHQHIKFSPIFYGTKHAIGQVHSQWGKKALPTGKPQQGHWDNYRQKNTIYVDRLYKNILKRILCKFLI